MNEPTFEQFVWMVLSSGASLIIIVAGIFLHHIFFGREKKGK
jgi:hypothetical protein